MSQLSAFLEAHPGWEPIESESEDDEEDDEDDNGESEDKSDSKFFILGNFFHIFYFFANFYLRNANYRQG